MGWLDAFTGKAAKKASGVQVEGLQRAQEHSLAALGGSYENARGALTDGAMPAVRQGYGDALSALRQFYPEAQGYAGQATAAFEPMISAGFGGVQAYGDAAGANGVAGNTRAVQNFQAGPGYEFARDQGLDAINRTAAARGMLAGGNNTTDLLKYSTGLADSTWGSYLQRLQPLMDMYGRGIAGKAAGLSGQADLASGMGTATANLHTGLGGALAGLHGGIADTHTQEGRSRADILSNIGQQIAQTQGQGIMGAANARAGTINAGLGLVGQLAGLPVAGVGKAAGGSFGGNLMSKWFG